MAQCTRCKKSKFNSFRIKRDKLYVTVNKCLICGFLWVEDEDLIAITKAESKKLFIETILGIGRGKENRQGENRK